MAVGTLTFQFFGWLTTGHINTARATGLTVTNFTLNHTTQQYSFNYTGYTGGDISTESVAIIATDDSWQFNDEPASCTGTTSGSGSCSGTFNYSRGTFACGGTVTVQIYGYNPSAFHYNVTNPDQSCSAFALLYGRRSGGRIRDRYLAGLP